MELAKPRALFGDAKTVSTSVALNTGVISNNVVQSFASPVHAPANIIPVRTVMDIVNFGASSAEKTSQFNDKILEESKASDVPMFEGKVVNILLLAKGVNLQEPTSVGFFGNLSKTIAKHREEVKSKFTSLSSQINNVVNEMATLTNTLTDRNNMLEQLYELNMKEYYSLEDHIAYGNQVLVEKRTELEHLKSTLLPSDLAGAQDLTDKQAFINRLEKRIDTLTRIKMTAIQTAPFIRLIQDNNLLLIEKFGDLTTMTIPAWKKQIALYLSLGDQKKGVEVANAIDDATNAFMRANSDALKQNTIDVYTASQRSVVDIDTLQYVQDNLIETLTAVSDISKQGQIDRAEGQKQMAAMQQVYLELSTGKA